MSPNTPLTKEAIASRMFRNAARIWDYNDTDLDNFDPLVRLLIEACSVEVYNINHEIANLQKRMLERLAKLLTPDVYTSAKPAHAVVHARSQEAVATVYPGVQFFNQKKIASKANGPLDSSIDLYFSPTGNHYVYDGDVQYIACGGNIYSVNEIQTKGSLLKCKKNIEPLTAWIGVELNEQLENLQGLTFFIDFKNLLTKNALIKALTYTKWSLNGISLNTTPGLWDSSEHKLQSDTLFGNEEFKTTPNLELNTNHYYKQHFITIESGNLTKKSIQDARTKLPVEIEDCIDEKELKNFASKLCWFKVEFPSVFDQHVLDEMQVSINCFPVLNRHLNEVRYRLQSLFNIIPLTTTEEFFDIKSVQNISGNTYTANPIEKQELSEKGTFALRHSAVERFDNRNATEHLNYLTELLRDESNAFAAYGQDFISTMIKDLNQNISKIEQKIHQNSTALKSNSTFLFLKPYEENENIFVEFWTTNGNEANGLRSGSKLDLYSGTDIRRENICLMTNTAGGRDKVSNTELLTSYRNTLLSRGRVVTSQDIKNLCQEVIGNRMQKVDIKKGLTGSSNPGEGLIQTIDVHITTTDKKMDPEETLVLQREIESKLELNSIVFSNYRVFLN